MARKNCAQILRSRLAMLALPFICATLASLSACDKNSDQPDRRYCDSTGCYACQGDRCYPIPGDPVAPNPVPNPMTSCDNDSACAAGQLCNLGRCEPSCTSDAACPSGSACISGRCRPSDSAKCGTTGARCTADSNCGSNERCVNRACATNCPDNKCALGQVCTAGSCVEDPAPASSQCVFDTDCGAAGKSAFRCINAYCLPTCTDNSTCATGATCLKGVCRGSR